MIIFGAKIERSAIESEKMSLKPTRPKKSTNHFSQVTSAIFIVLGFLALTSQTRTDWVETYATVSKSEFLSRIPVSSKYRIGMNTVSRVTYDYTVGDKDFQAILIVSSDNIAVGKFSSPSPGSKLHIQYSKSSPEISRIFVRYSYAMWVLGFIFIVIGLLVLRTN